jgi:hypothetical protein
MQPQPDPATQDHRKGAHLDRKQKKQQNRAQGKARTGRLLQLHIIGNNRNRQGN